MSRTTEQRLARALQAETLHAYSTCLNAVRRAQGKVPEGPDFNERWADASRRELAGAPRVLPEDAYPGNGRGCGVTSAPWSGPTPRGPLTAAATRPVKPTG